MPPPSSYRQSDHSPAFANAGAKSEALKKAAESRQYLRPGAKGIVPAMERGGYGLQNLAWGGPMETGAGPDALVPEKCWAERLSALDEVDRERKEEEEMRLERKGPSLARKIKTFVRGGRVKGGGGGGGGVVG